MMQYMGHKDVILVDRLMVAGLDAKLRVMDKKINVLTVELALLHDKMAKDSGSPVINTNSEYYTTVHTTHTDLAEIRRSLDILERVETEVETPIPASTANSNGDLGLSTVRVKLEPRSSQFGYGGSG